MTRSTRGLIEDVGACRFFCGHNAIFENNQVMATNSRARSINIFLLDGETDGVRSAQIAMSTIHAVAFKRSQLVRVRNEFKEIARPGVYLLLGENVEGDRIAYVGESEDVAARLQRHTTIDTKDFWIDTIAFVSKDENLTKSHARFVESLLIAAAKASKTWAVVNSQNPSDVGKLPKPDECAMLEFIDQTKTLTSALGFDLFKVTSGKLTPQPPALGDAVTVGIDSPPFRYYGGDFDATAIVSGSTGEWVVKAGSKARLQETNTLPKGAKTRRSQLLEKQVLKEVGTALEFTSDYAFSSASQAASVVGGGSVAGPQVWKFDGQSYGDWEAARSGTGIKTEFLPDLLTPLG